MAVRPEFGKLPLSKRWGYVAFVRTNITIPPGTVTTLFDFEWAGWVVIGFVSQNNPNLIGTFELETDEELVRDSFTANTLLIGGLTLPQPAGWWVSRYDAINSFYVVAYTPSVWTPFYKRFKFFLSNTTTSTITVSEVRVLIAKIREAKE